MTGEARRELWGTVLDGQYALTHPIGVGATGVVFEATRLSDGQVVAIKVLKDEEAHYPDLARRLRREAQVAREIRHPGIAQSYAEGNLLDGSPYVVLERLRGESLLHLLRRRGRLEVDETLAIARGLSRVLSAVHGAGYVHRDLKPEHVWLSAEGESLAVHLIDFGVCQAPETGQEHGLRERGRVFGTPGYVSPEQATAEAPVDGRSDLYGLGATLFEALAGERPFRGSNAAVLLRLALTADAPPLSRFRSDIPLALELLVASLMARETSARPLNARVVERLVRVLGGAALARAERKLATRLVTGSVQEASSPTCDAGSPTREVPAFAAV